MRKTILLALAVLTLQACKKKEPAPEPIGFCGTLIPGSYVALLKVDYLTHKFEGLSVLQFQEQYANDSLPIKMLYKPAGDFGNVTLFYTPNNDTVFDGSVVWMGLGTMKRPTIYNAASIDTVATITPAPDSSKVKMLGIQYAQPANQPMYPQQGKLDTLWKPISNLRFAQQVANSPRKKGLFLYQPSIGIGDPATWDWYWILSF